MAKPVTQIPDTVPMLGFGTIVVGTTPMQFPVSLAPLRFIELRSADGKHMIGDSTVTFENGYKVEKGLRIPIADTAQLWVVADKADKRLAWIAF